MLPTPPRKEYAPGDVIIDKYRLLQLLGEGGMGSVWVAENMALKANVALKLIRADVAEASANDRFLSEARLAARLQHAAIVRVFDFGKTQNDEPFIVMELLEGETLGQRLTRLGSIDPVELCQTLLPIIDALHSAHGHGVIHRDLKPDNVFIAKAEGGGVQPKLLDFGIAKLRGESAFHTTKLTQAGTLIGSPDYMSPEQAKGETDLDPRSDLWALCVLAYECLVGKPPFHGDNYNALLWSIIHDEPVPITVFQAGDPELWRLLKTGFAKDRNGRWDSARKLGEALALWLENHGIVEDVCNRSLHASWLPAERPTQPELTPFDQNALPAGQRLASSYAALVPAPTLPAMRRPHRWSVWFAAAGLATLAVAFFRHSASEDESGLVMEAKAVSPIPQVEKRPLRTKDDNKVEASPAERPLTSAKDAHPYQPEAETPVHDGKSVEFVAEKEVPRAGDRPSRAADPFVKDINDRLSPKGEAIAGANKAPAPVGGLQSQSQLQSQPQPNKPKPATTPLHQRVRKGDDGKVDPDYDFGI